LELNPEEKSKNTLLEKPLPIFKMDYSVITKYFCETKKKKGGSGSGAKQTLPKQGTRARTKREKQRQFGF
jgi:hypothetical protein